MEILWTVSQQVLLPDGTILKAHLYFPREEQAALAQEKLAGLAAPKTEEELSARMQWLYEAVRGETV